MNTIAERAVAIGTALADYPDMPYSNLFVGHGLTLLSVPGYQMDGVRDVAKWARGFNAEVIVILSSSSVGKVATNVILGGVPVAVDSNIGTAQAYELGRILQRELTRDVAIHIGADELLAAIDQAVAS